jgi:predicted DNA-binding ArsR family transcriptional regulator
MKKDPVRKRSPKELISSVRHNDTSADQLTEILADNPLYTSSVVIRGAILAIYRMTKEAREALIREAAGH